MSRITIFINTVLVFLTATLYPQSVRCADSMNRCTNKKGLYAACCYTCSLQSGALYHNKNNIGSSAEKIEFSKNHTSYSQRKYPSGTSTCFPEIKIITSKTFQHKDLMKTAKKNLYYRFRTKKIFHLNDHFKSRPVLIKKYLSNGGIYLSLNKLIC